MKAQPAVAIHASARRWLATAALSASRATAAKATAETVFAPEPSISGSRCHGIASGGSHAGNAKLIRRGATTLPHQTTAPNTSNQRAERAARFTWSSELLIAPSKLHLPVPPEGPRDEHRDQLVRGEHGIDDGHAVRVAIKEHDAADAPEVVTPWSASKVW